MSKIYTKTGDNGTTSLVGGSRINKSDAILDVYGTCDELNAHIGVIIAEENVPFLTDIQENLFVMGGILATPKENYNQYWEEVSWDAFLSEIETEIDAMEEELPPLNTFLLPQGSFIIAKAHICRTLCRKLERKMAHFSSENEHFSEILKIANRLSDYFFILARYFHYKFEIEEKCFKMR